MHIHHALHPDRPPLSYDVDEADFAERVVARSQEIPVLVDIGADWCSPCLMLTPLLEKLVAEYDGRVLLARVDADENMRLAGRHQVRGFPTVIAYSRGEEVDRFHSAKPMHFLREFADRIIARHIAGSTHDQVSRID